MSLPSPQGQGILGHLGRWGQAPLELLTEGASLSALFEIRLWRRALVGYSPAWNRLILGDLDTFQSKGSLSSLTPYLGAGIVQTDAPDHKPRRMELNPHFTMETFEPWRERLTLIVSQRIPTGRFDALSWAVETVTALLNEAFFGSTFPPDLLARFLSPLEQRVPAPLLPRPLLFRHVNTRLKEILKEPPPETLAAHLAPIDRAAEELRVALAAGFDTTAHTLAWALWHIASEPAWRTPDHLPLVMKETLRLYPAGWLGSRISRKPFSFENQLFKSGLLVFYSPYLTHRDPQLWPEPLTFNPNRFEQRPPPWGYLPFAAGSRTCLGRQLALLMLELALTPFLSGGFRPLSGIPEERTGLTLAPRGPVWLEFTP